MRRMTLLLTGLCALSGCQMLQGAGKDLMNFGHAISGDGIVDYNSPAPSSYSRGYGYGNQKHYEGLYSSRGTSGTPTYMVAQQKQQPAPQPMPQQSYAAPAPQQMAYSPYPPQAPAAQPQMQYGGGNYGMQPVSYSYAQPGYSANAGYNTASYSYTPTSYSAMAGYQSYY